jgi:alcohol dehydrogenase class IV
MGHALGAVFHVPHGRAVGLFLPYTLEFVAREAPDRFAEVADFIDCSDKGGEKAAGALVTRIRDLCHEIGGATRVAEIDIERDAYEAQMDKLVDDAFNDTQMVTAARAPSYEELRQLFLYAYDGKSVDF